MSQFANYIDGQWVDGASVSRNVNPSNLDDVIGEFAQADAEQTQRAIRAARNAFAQWSLSTPQQRFDLLDQAGSTILARKAELGRLLAREEGKTLPEAIGEVGRAGQIFKFFAGEALRIGGEIVPSVRPGMTVEVTREPLGVIGLITPWNFPIAIPAWKIAPALAYGNTVVVKPADLVPASTWELVRIIAEAGAPAGVINLVMGQGAVVGEALVSSPQVDAVSFTGSVATGRAIGAKCFASGKKFQLEMGGKNPMVVLDDADLDVAVEACINGGFYSTGQRCTASSRFIVTEGIHDRFIDAMKARMQALKVGDALADGTHIGPVVDDKQLQQDERYIAIAREEGGTIFGGERIERDTRGYFLAPALITDTTPDMRINREEVFGPVASVIKVKDYNEALAVANDTEFGLSAGICTTSLKYSSHFRRHVQAGMVMVNTATAGVDYHVPFGGRKGSSYGPREQGSYAREFYTTVKTAYVSPGAV
ncbi:aldehyde dehydrogenase family protein [Paraburkholderia xenovorans LB400]|uniref:Betaine-aldehyde dehydrogenase n=1 Tax=Paraburkholderia xenovorans (strain LB400) TaxID=266265 RepID=Q13FD2_PARXL|nr:aldehyde dehydrogenase family protein [Paraburkholderia xenovorans]ABE37207.1 Betaine-aldehyde dehydrogenase [Paraburkholderia xenovorans LB400]AIP34674.1 aldehyde dehydrogenase family protein [Paraburkholderia xenovorans LB400]